MRLFNRNIKLSPNINGIGRKIAGGIRKVGKRESESTERSDDSDTELPVIVSDEEQDAPQKDDSPRTEKRKTNNRRRRRRGDAPRGPRRLGRKGIKKVRFVDEESNEVHKVIKRRSQFSRESIANIWFESDEFKDFVDDAKKTIERIEKGKQIKDKKYTATGLDGFTEEGLALKSEYRNCAYDAVLWEQHNQLEEGKPNSTRLADVYHQAAKEAEMRALFLASKVRKEVVEYMTSDDIDFRKDRNSKQSKGKGDRRAKLVKRRSSWNL